MKRLLPVFLAVLSAGCAVSTIPDARARFSAPCPPPVSAQARLVKSFVDEDTRCIYVDSTSAIPGLVESLRERFPGKVVETAAPEFESIECAAVYSEREEWLSATEVKLYAHSPAERAEWSMICEDGDWRAEGLTTWLSEEIPS